MEPTPPVEEPQVLEPEDEISTDASEDMDDTADNEETVTINKEPAVTKTPAKTVTKDSSLIGGAN